jgi:DNA-binding transcriptional MerR regulator
MNKSIKIKEASEILGIHKQTLMRYEKKGYIKSRRSELNNYRYFDYDDLMILKEKIIN